MADIKKIKVGSTIYDIRDATAARSNHNHEITANVVVMSIKRLLHIR